MEIGERVHGPSSLGQVGGWVGKTFIIITIIISYYLPFLSPDSCAPLEDLTEKTWWESPAKVP